MSFLQRIDGLVAEGNIDMAKAALIGQLDKDRFLNPMQVASDLDYLQSRTFFEKDDGDFTLCPQSMWTTDYWTSIRVALLNNFSFEKLKHCVSVMQFLRNNNEEGFFPTQQMHKENSPKKRQVEVKHAGFFDRLIGVGTNGKRGASRKKH